MSAAVIAIGCFGTWARAFGILSVDGLDTTDGKIALGVAAVAALMLYLYGRGDAELSPAPVRVRVAALLLAAGLVGVVVAMEDLEELLGVQGAEEVAGGDDLASPGWGLWAVALGSASLVLASIELMFAARRRGDQPFPGRPSPARAALGAVFVAAAVLATMAISPNRDASTAAAGESAAALSPGLGPAA